ncbi:MAG TPA: MFS transporter, partial [Thermodesulfobacteriota bacterium]|nr:MFS transporter [Thermodesulfobacteriota bacterium]
AVLRLPEPPRGGAERPLGGAAQPTRADYAALLRTPSYRYAVAGYTLFNFAVGGLSYWMPAFLVRLHGVPVAEAGVTVGAITVLGGLVGVLAGGWLGDRVQARAAGGYFLVSGAGMLLATPVAVFALLAPDAASVYPAILLAEILLYLNTAPLNAVVVNVTRPQVRATAIALHTFVIHALGDVISPPLIGHLSDRIGLRPATLLTAVAIALSGLVLLAGARHLPADLARMAGGRAGGRSGRPGTSSGSGA